MKALSLIQPWASAIILGSKKIETRSWNTNHRGRIAIHASKGMPKWAKEFASTERALGRLPSRLPLGAIIGIADLVDVIPVEIAVLSIYPIEKLYGDYTSGRWAWLLKNVEAFPDDMIIHCKGALGLWTVLDEIDIEIERIIHL